MTENLSGLKTFDHMVKRVQGLTEVRRSHDSHVTFFSFVCSLSVVKGRDGLLLGFV